MHVPNEIKARYFERRKQDLEDCVRHLKNGEMNFLEKVGHKLKGNGITFGYPELSEIGGQLEKAAREESDVELKMALNKFSDWVENHLS